MTSHAIAQVTPQCPAGTRRMTGAPNPNAAAPMNAPIRPAQNRRASRYVKTIASQTCRAMLKRAALAAGMTAKSRFGG